MANVRYLLSRAFSPGSSLKMDCSSSAISPADVLTAMGMMGEIVPGFNGVVSAMLHVKWGLDSTQKLHQELLRYVVWQFGRKRWAVYDRTQCTATETLDLFVEQVITEWNGGVCHKCLGRGTVPNMNGVVSICQTCRGAQRAVISAYRRAVALNMDKHDIKDRWGERLDFIVKEMVEIERRALSKINYKIEG
ncbi:MAG: hypothetical protein ABIT70_12475 [Sulfuriferula sp.]